MDGMLGGQDMVEHGSLVEVGIFSLGRNPEEILRELEHIVGVASLRTIVIVDEIYAGGSAREMLAAAVAAESQGAVLRDCLPEEAAGLGIVRASAKLADASETDRLRNLCIGVKIVQTVLVTRKGLHYKLV